MSTKTYKYFRKNIDGTYKSTDEIFIKDEFKVIEHINGWEGFHAVYPEIYIRLKLNDGNYEWYYTHFKSHYKKNERFYFKRTDKKGSYHFYLSKKKNDYIVDYSSGKKYENYFDKKHLENLYMILENEQKVINKFVRKELKVKALTFKEAREIKEFSEKEEAINSYLPFINDDHDEGLLNVIFSMYFPYSNKVSIKVLPQMYNPFEEGYVNKLNETSLENFFANAMDELFDTRQIYSTTRSMYLNRGYLTLVKKQKNKKCKYGFPIEVSLDDKNEYKYLGFIIEIEEQRIYISVPINLLLTKNNKYSYIQIMFNIDEMKFRIYTLDKNGRLFGYTTEDRELVTNEKSITLTAFKDDPNDPSDFDFYFLLDNTIDLYGVEDITRITP